MPACSGGSGSSSYSDSYSPCACRALRLKLGPDGITNRQSEEWSSTTRLGVTQNGFPWGRLLAQDLTASETVERLGIPIADPNRLTALAVLYAELATSDPVSR